MYRFVSNAALDACNAACGNWSESDATLECLGSILEATLSLGDLDVYDLYSNIYVSGHTFRSYVSVSYPAG